MITDQMLSAAAAELNDALLAALPDAPSRHPFSRKFHRKITRLIRSTKHPILHKAMQRTAGFALVLLLSLMLLIAASPIVRAKLFAWIREQYASFVEYSIPETSAPAVTERSFGFGKLPPGYDKIAEFSTVNLHMSIYANDKQEQIHFIYAPSEKTGSIFIKNEAAIRTETEVSGYPGDFFMDHAPGKSNALIWQNTDLGYTFYLSAPMEKEEMLAIAKNIFEK